MNESKIEWLAPHGRPGFAWNPVTGCTKVSEGCRHCYAERWSKRQMGPWKGRRFEDVRTHDERLDGPLRKLAPAWMFVNSMSDLFHAAVPEEFIDRVFAVMALAPRHTFIVLTKRPDRMRAYCADRVSAGGAWHIETRMIDAAGHTARGVLPPDWRPLSWPLPNVILGVSVEDQRSADERIPLLLETPAAVRAVSYEPALGPVDFGPFLTGHDDSPCPVSDPSCVGGDGDCHDACERRTRIDWIIVGGESGPGARPFSVEWARDTRDQCKAAGVPCFVKQLGAVVTHDDPESFVDDEAPWPDGTDIEPGCTPRIRLRDRAGGDPDEWPEDLRVRQWPELNR